jgi:predicted nucleic acid-binding protein
MDKPSIFLDSSVVIAALLSVQGGSSYILREKHELFEFQASEHVLSEVQDVLSGKLKEQSHLSATLFLLLGIAEVQTVPNPSKLKLASIAGIISNKDAPILVSAMEHSDYLLTLDNEFFKTAIVQVAKENNLGILKPGDLVQLFDL